MSRRILIACEFSGRVRDAFRARGYDAISCDIDDDLPLSTAVSSRYHYQGDVLDILNDGWDMMIAFPPCTHLCISGRAHWAKRQLEQKKAIEFVKTLWRAPIPHIAIENPVGILSRVLDHPNQICQPSQFGDDYRKTTCLWLKNLPNLEPTDIVEVPPERENYILNMSPGPNRKKLRSLTPFGLAEAMADQWGSWTSVQLELFEVPA